MRNEMQQLTQLTQLLNQTTDPDERERIEEEIFNLETDLEESDDYDYRVNHQKLSDF